jgi:hypothetical protein
LKVKARMQDMKIPIVIYEHIKESDPVELEKRILK